MKRDSDRDLRYTLASDVSRATAAIYKSVVDINGLVQREKLTLPLDTMMAVSRQLEEARRIVAHVEELLAPYDRRERVNHRRRKTDDSPTG